MAPTVLTEQTLRDKHKQGIQRVVVPLGTIVTALAAEFAAAHGMTITHEEESARGEPARHPSAASASAGKSVAIGSDHGGFALKSALIVYLNSLGVQVLDVGTYSEEPCDYPDFAYGVAKSVVDGKAQCGIMVDGAGTGSCMVVNKVPGIRGACCAHEFTARNAREHNDANVLTLGSRVVGLEVAKGIVQAFLDAGFAGGRHSGRVSKIMDIEKKFFRQ